MSHAALARPHPATRSAVLTKAVLNAAERLGLNARTLAAVIGVSEATVSRMRHGDHLLDEGSKPYELAVLLVRAFRSLDAIAGGEAKVVRGWMTSPNSALNGTPIEKIRSIVGLMDVIDYLDARRALA